MMTYPQACSVAPLLRTVGILSGLPFIQNVCFYIMDHNFDTEPFITETEARTAIWDFRPASYGDKVEKTRCWEILISKMFPDFEVKTLAERNELCKE